MRQVIYKECNQYWNVFPQFVATKVSLVLLLIVLLFCGLQSAQANTAIDAIFNIEEAYVKASDTTLEDRFGYASKISADGNTLAVSTCKRDNSTGAVYIFSRNGVTWTQEASIQASNAEEKDGFGVSVSLSADGQTLAVGATSEDSNDISEQNDNSARDSGAAYIFTRTGSTWTQQAYLKSSNIQQYAHFGRSVTLSNDGNTVVVGAWKEGERFSKHGAAYVFTRNGNNGWGESTVIDTPNRSIEGFFGYSATLSADNNTLAISAVGEKRTGVVHIFTYDGNNWNAEGYVEVQPGISSRAYYFGQSIDLSSDGNTLAVGNPYDHRGSGGKQSGATYIFTRTNAVWSQQALLKASNSGFRWQFGRSVALSADGNTLAVGALFEGIRIGNANEADNPYRSGATFIFTRNANTWQEQKIIRTSNKGRNDNFGDSVSLSDDGKTLAVSTTGESSNATGVNGNQFDDSVRHAGAVYVFRTSNANLDITVSSPQKRKMMKSAPAYNSGQNVRYVITVKNNGPDTATDVLITDVPNNLAINSVSGAGCTAIPCTITSINNGESKTITIDTTINSAGPFAYSASVSSNAFDVKSNNNNSSSNGVAGTGGTTSTSGVNSSPASIPSLGALGLLVTMFGFITLLYRRKSQLFVK